MEDEDKILTNLMEACAIASGLRLLINQLRTSTAVHDIEYRSLMSFLAELHWRYYKIQRSRKVEEDPFGRLRLKDDKRKNIDLN